MKIFRHTPSRSGLLEEMSDHSRRLFLQRTGVATLSATGITLLSGCANASYGPDKEGKVVARDITILNTAISAEHEAVAAYQAGAESGLLQAGVLRIALQFQGHHKAHVEALEKAVNALGGSSVGPKTDYDFPLEKLNNQTDVLEFAAGLERGAVSAYAGAIGVFEDRDLAKAAASILADEAMHWAVLRNALGLDPVPGAFFS